MQVVKQVLLVSEGTPLGTGAPSPPECRRCIPCVALRQAKKGHLRGGFCDLVWMQPDWGLPGLLWTQLTYGVLGQSRRAGAVLRSQ